MCDEMYSTFNSPVSIYCEALDGECFEFHNCYKCEHLLKTHVPCSCCGKYVKMQNAHRDLNGDFICIKCEKEGAE